MSQTTLRSNCWSLTINNPTADDEEQINLARQRGWKVEGQLEKGLEGTEHYQLRLMTPQVRFSAVKKAFPRAHIEIARDSVALGKYVTKEATKVADLPTGQDRYPSLSRTWDLIYQHYNTTDKDGWDLSLEDTIAFYNERSDTEFTKSPLVVFDRAVRVLITQGYHLESICANPSTRSMWKLYAREIMYRCRKNLAEVPPPALETEDSQTDSVEIPTYFLEPMIITKNGSHAWSSSSCTGPPPPPGPSSFCNCSGTT